MARDNRSGYRAELDTLFRAFWDRMEAAFDVWERDDEAEAPTNLLGELETAVDEYWDKFREIETRFESEREACREEEALEMHVDLHRLEKQ